MKKQLDEKRMMVVDDPMEAVCNTAVFLASDQSIGITGECINGNYSSCHYDHIQWILVLRMYLFTLFVNKQG